MAPFSDAPVKHLDPSRPTAHPEGLLARWHPIKGESVYLLRGPLPA